MLIQVQNLVNQQKIDFVRLSQTHKVYGVKFCTNCLKRNYEKNECYFYTGAGSSIVEAPHKVLIHISYKLYKL